MANKRISYDMCENILQADDCFTDEEASTEKPDLSREKAAALIRSDRVEINHFTAASVSQELKEGDILSVRGSGRYILSGIDGLTKKGRIHINLRKYI